MIRLLSRLCKRPAAGRAFSLVETAICVVIVGVMYVAAMNTVAASRVSQSRINERGHGYLLAQALMGEILQQAYEDTEVAVRVFGIEPNELPISSRAAFDDVDDYDNWSFSPPQDRDGDPIPNTGWWTRSVFVDRVKPENVNQVVGAERGVKRITVTVREGNRDLATLVALRSRAR